jgi:hypothetical protein
MTGPVSEAGVRWCTAEGGNLRELEAVQGREQLGLVSETGCGQ